MVGGKCREKRFSAGRTSKGFNSSPQFAKDSRSVVQGLKTDPCVTRSVANVKHCVEIGKSLGNRDGYGIQMHFCIQTAIIDGCGIAPLKGYPVESHGAAGTAFVNLYSVSLLVVNLGEIVWFHAQDIS